MLYYRTEHNREIRMQEKRHTYQRLRLQGVLSDVTKMALQTLELCLTLPAVTPLTLLELSLAFPAVTPQHCCDARRPIARLRTRRSRAPSAGVKCMCTRSVKSGRWVKSMNPKTTKKSPIHENADANITCDFGDSDISRSRICQSNTRLQTSFVTSSIVRWCTILSIFHRRWTTGQSTEQLRWMKP